MQEYLIPARAGINGQIVYQLGEEIREPGLLNQRICDMINRPNAGTEDTGICQPRIQDCIIFSAPFYEKNDIVRGNSYGFVLVAMDRIILLPVPLTHVSGPDVRDTSHDRNLGKTEPYRIPARTRDSSRLESLGSRAGDYLNRDAGEIVRKEKNTRVLPFENIREIIIIRVHTNSRSSRWLSILFALYSLEPAGAHYSVDYQLTIVTPGDTYLLVTPFSLPLKKVLVDRLGDRVREIVDEYAPLL